MPSGCLNDRFHTLVIQIEFVHIQFGRIEASAPGASGVCETGVDSRSSGSGAMASSAEFATYAGANVILSHNHNDGGRGQHAGRGPAVAGFRSSGGTWARCSAVEPAVSTTRPDTAIPVHRLINNTTQKCFRALQNRYNTLVLMLDILSTKSAKL